MKKYFTILLCIGMCVSCKSIFKPKGFKYCYTQGGDNQIDYFINTDGYYIAQISDKKMGKDTVFITTLFEKDGSLMTTGSLVGGKRDSVDFKQVAENNHFHFYVCWGAYKISEDSIFTQYVEEISDSQYYAVNWNYKILNRNTLIGTYLNNENESIRYEMKFVPFSNNLGNYNPLKKYKWFKCK